MKANPFETSPEDKAANLERVKADREAKDAERGHSGSDGFVLDAIERGADRLMRDDGPLDQMAKGAGFEDPDGEIGGLAAGIGERVRDIGGKLGGGPQG